MKSARVAVPFVAIGLFAANSFAGIQGSVHDLTTAPVNAAEICQPCHVPHMSNAKFDQEPVLWNHDVATGAGYTFYTTLDGDTSTLNGISKLCLGCHDGSIALDNYGGATGGSNFIDPGEQVGPDMSNDHPIGLTYPSAETGYYSVDANNKVNGSVIPVFDIGGTDMVECASCHDPHDTTNGRFLRMDNTDSALCLTCHNK